MSALATYILVALMAWCPPHEHDFTRVDVAETVARYSQIADDIALVAEESPLFAGDDGPLRTAVLLASVASFESGNLRADIDSCEASGDGGKAWSLWQLHRPKERICGSRRDAARAAVDMLRASMSACRALTQAERLAVFASGRCSSGRRESRNRWDRAASWLRDHRFEAST